jgi:flagellar secretion chaperone FliS
MSNMNQLGLAADRYLEDAVENAPPVKLIRMLYEGAVKFLDRGVACAQTGNRAGFIHWLSRSNAIVTELRLSLIPVEGSDIAPNLDALYDFCEERLLAAMEAGQPEPALEARKVLATLLEAWQHIELSAGQS